MIDPMKLVPWERVRAAWSKLGSHYLEKYATDDGMHAAFCMECARELQLEDMPPHRILDIGCGLGVFVELCRELGHDCTGLDSDMPCTRAIDGIIGGPRIFHTINESSYLPNDLGQFDIVTLHRVNLFMAHDTTPEKKAAHWRAFISVLFQRTGCKLIHVNMNAGEQAESLLKTVPDAYVWWHGSSAFIAKTPKDFQKERIA